MKKKIIIILISVIIVIGIGIGIFSYLSYSREQEYENRVHEAITFIDNGDYTSAQKIINTFENDIPEEIETTITSKVQTYVILRYEEFREIDEDDWKDIKELSIFVQGKFEKEYNYLTKLLELQEYVKYIPAIDWMNSTDYDVWESYLEMEDESAFSKIASLLPKYSFEKYGLDSIYIKELNEAKDKFAECCKIIAEALVEQNSEKINSVYDESAECIAIFTDTTIKIITTQDELNNKIALLPEI